MTHVTARRKFLASMALIAIVLSQAGVQTYMQSRFAPIANAAPLPNQLNFPKSSTTFNDKVLAAAEADIPNIRSIPYLAAAYDTETLVKMCNVMGYRKADNFYKHVYSSCKNDTVLYYRTATDTWETVPGCTAHMMNKRLRCSDPLPQCQNNNDDDDDGLVDMADPDCSSPDDDDEHTTLPPPSQCSDGIDNDGDGATDYAGGDFSCSGLNDTDETNPKAKCQDETDNDGDGKRDYPEDAGCGSKQDNDEYNLLPQCSDNVDNDGDGKIDWNGGCTFTSTNATPTNTSKLPDALFQEVLSTLSAGMPNTMVIGANENPFTVRTEVNEKLLQYDLSIIHEQMNPPPGEDIGGALRNSSDTLKAVCNLFGYKNVSSSKTKFAGDGRSNYTSCSNNQHGIWNGSDMEMDGSCGGKWTSQLVCSTPFTPPTSTCSPITQPDPNCTGPTDDDESSPTTQCNDGIDNDGDGKIDFPQDRGCSGPEDDDERGLPMRFEMLKSSGESPIAGGVEYFWNIKVMNVNGGAAVDMVLIDNVPQQLHITRVTSPDNPSIQCSVAGQRVTCTTPMFNVGEGDHIYIYYTVNAGTTGTIENCATVTSDNIYMTPDTGRIACGSITIALPECRDGIDNDNDGAIDYPADFSCSGPDDNDETNPKAQCQDGADNDNDGKVDYPLDPGCSSKQDNDEFNQLPQCSDGIDNDNDGAIDYPADFSCSGPTDNDETNPKAKCQDGIDNDGDNLIDYPQDPGCTSKQDDDEFNAPTDSDVSIVKSGPSAVVRTIGEQTILAYTIKVKNNGNATTVAAAQNVVIHDDIPFGTTFVSSPHSSEICQKLLNQQKVECTLPATLQPGVEETVYLAFALPNVSREQCADVSVENSATVSAMNDGTPGNNTSQEVTTEVECPEPIEGCIEIQKITQDAWGQNLTPVTQFTFWLDMTRSTQNNSQGRARFDNVGIGNHMVTEDLPPGWERTGTTSNPIYVAGDPQCTQVTYVNRQLFVGSSSSSSSNVPPSSSSVSSSVSSVPPSSMSSVSSSSSNVPPSSSSVSSSSVSSVPPSSMSSVASSSAPLGCIDVMKEVFDPYGYRIATVPPFLFTLDNGRTAVNDTGGHARFENVAVGEHAVHEAIPNGWMMQLVTPVNGIVTVPANGCATVTFKNRMTTIITSSSSSAVSSSVSSVSSSSVSSVSSVSSSVVSSSSSVAGLADVTLAKTGTNIAIPGRPYTYSFTAKNAVGAQIATANNVTIYESIPAGFQFIGSTNATCSQNSPTSVLCSVGPLVASAQLPFTVSFDVPPGIACGSHSNLAMISTTTPESNVGNNVSDSVITSIPCPSSSSVSSISSVSSSSVSSISSVPVSSTSSTSSSTAFGCIDIIKDTVDQYGNAIYTVPPFTFTLDGARTTVNAANGRARFDTVTPGTHSIVEATASGWLLQSVTPVNGTVQVTPGACTTVIFRNKQSPTAAQNFTISKTDGQSSAEPEEELTYRITVKNNSNATVQNVVVTDTLDTDLNFLEASHNAQRSGRIVTWNLTFAPFETKELTVDVEVDQDAEGTIRNKAKVFDFEATDSTDVDDGNDDDDDEDTTAGGDISVRKEANTGEVFPGGFVEYTITVQNTGDERLSNLTVTDRLPGGVFILNTGNADSNANGVLTWKIGTLNKDATWTATYRVSVDPSAYPGQLLRNDVTVKDSNVTRTASYTVAVIGNLPQTGVLGGPGKSNVQLRPIHRTQEDETSALALSVWATLMGIFGTGAGAVIGRKILFGF